MNVLCLCIFSLKMKSLLPIPTPAAAPARSQRISKHFVKNEEKVIIDEGM